MACFSSMPNMYNALEIPDDDKTTNRVVLSEIEQSKYDVLYGDSLQRPAGKRK